MSLFSAASPPGLSRLIHEGFGEAQLRAEKGRALTGFSRRRIQEYVHGNIGQESSCFGV